MVLAVLVVGIVIGSFLADSGSSLTPAANAAGGRVESRVGIAPDRYVYYPGTEELGKDEIRIIACGTGMPGARRGQAATCFLVELGDGQKFLFDIGTGAMRNVQALMIPANYLTKVFLTHLHTDHWGDLATLWAGGWTSGRTVPLEVWGPSGAREDMGTKYAVEHFLKAYNWDYMTRAVTINPIPGGITVHEFDYKDLNQVIYDEKGVRIRSWPTIHTGDGPVSYALEWNGYKIIIGGDTAPNKWEIEYAKDADLFIHEAFMTSNLMMNKYGQPAQLALRINFTFHTSAQSFGKIMSLTKPRHAVAYHFFNEPDTRYPIFEGIRETYKGPLSMATDNMMWNITRDKITERMVVSPDEAWDVEGPGEKLAPDRTRKSEYTPFILQGNLDMTDVNKSWADKFMKEHGLSPDILKADQKKSK
ncbi:MAG: guanitoxin biosynthesis MBL fold metallo-hydrolase GntH [Planctomycetota bacterium]